MEYLRGYRVLRRDPDWVRKLVVGSILMLSTLVVPMIGQVIVIGWQARIMRDAVRGRVTPMPPLDWDRGLLKELIGLGFKGLVAQMIWTMPVLVVGVVASLGAPFALIGIAGDADDPVATLSWGLGIVGAVLVVLVVAALIPAQVAAMRAELTGDLMQGLRVGPILTFTRRMLRELIAGTVITGVVGLLVLLGGSLCCVGLFPASVVILVVQGHFLAQVYQRWVEAGGEELDVG